MTASVSVVTQPERLIPVSKISPSKTNPRKSFANIESLAEDLKVHGVLQPLLVRPSSKGDGFELIFGERRLRAAKLAKLAEVPCKVADYPDNLVLELQLVENVQREDVHPLEEAEGYDRLHKEYGYTVDQIVERCGKTRGWVYARMKLVTLCGAARQAFLEGRLASTIALYIARIPSPALQEKALDAVAPKHGHPLDARDALRLIQAEYMLRLRDAQFLANGDPADLVPKAGTCASCPKSTGNQRELFAEQQGKQVMCTDPACFASKQKAHHKRLVGLWKERHLPVLSDAECRTLFGSYGTQVTTGKGYIDLDSACFHVPFDAKGNPRTYRSLLPADFGPVVLAIDGRNFSHELVEDGAQLRRALERFMPKKTDRPTTDPKAKARARAKKRATAELVDRILKRQTSLETFRLAAHTLYDGLSLEACESAHPMGVEKAIELSRTTGEVWRLIVAIAAENAPDDTWAKFAKRYNVDVARFEREEIAALRAGAS